MANIATFVAATSAAVATFGGDEGIGAVDIGQSQFSEKQKEKNKKTFCN